MIARLRDEEAGVGLVEMALVVALLGLVLGLALQSFVSFQDATAGNDVRGQNLAEARLAMAVATLDLRTATEFLALGGSDVTFLGNLRTAATDPPNKLRLYVDAEGRLVEAVTRPDDPTATPVTYTGTPTTRVVGRWLVDTGSLFTFNDAVGNPTSDPSTVRSVTIALSVDSPTNLAVDPTTLSSEVWLPNIAAGI